MGGTFAAVNYEALHYLSALVTGVVRLMIAVFIVAYNSRYMSDYG
jgi:hypothetical protein